MPDGPTQSKRGTARLQALASECHELACRVAGDMGVPEVQALGATGAARRDHLLRLTVMTSMPRALNGFDALVLLCRHGWGLEAGILLRVLFEGMVNAGLIAANPKPFLFLYLEGTKRNIRDSMKALERARAASGGVLPADLEADSQTAGRELEEVTRWLDRVLGSPPKSDPYAWWQSGHRAGKRRFWHEVSLEERSRIAGLEGWYDIVYRLMSPFVHTSAGTHRHYIVGPPEPALLYGPRPEAAMAVLPYACHVLLMHLVTVDTALGLSRRPRIDAQLERVSTALKSA
jgi:hypothetical protein